MSPHGTRSRYINQRCRCGPCKEAQRLYHAYLRVRLSQRPEDVPHGVSGYVNWQCRCGICRAAKSAAARARYERTHS